MTMQVRRLIYVAAILPCAAEVPTDYRSHCADATGSFVGLVGDFYWDATADEAGESWELIHASGLLDDKEQPSPANSYLGVYLQVEPDDGDSHAPGTSLDADPFADICDVRFAITVRTAGIHTLSVRWTAGDTVGGGDSLFAVMRRASVDGKGAIVGGLLTYKPKLEPIADSRFSGGGCCYDMVTHACPCHHSDIDCTGYWADADSAAGFGAVCEVGSGEMEIVRAPRWYLFAGQEDGNVLDFDSEPFDATCEAEGVSTRDTGLDFAQWELDAGDYELHFYPREDGTALEGWFLAGPDTSMDQLAPADLPLMPGASTLCPDVRSGGGGGGDQLSGGVIAGIVCSVLIVVAVAVAALWLFKNGMCQRGSTQGARSSYMQSSFTNNTQGGDGGGIAINKVPTSSSDGTYEPMVSLTGADV